MRTFNTFNSDLGYLILKGCLSWIELYILGNRYPTISKFFSLQDVKAYSLLTGDLVEFFTSFKEKCLICTCDIGLEFWIYFSESY